MTDLRSCTKAGVGFAVLFSATAAFGVGSDLPDGSVVIAALPFTDIGDTTGFADNADFQCPYTGSTSPDVFYRYTPAADEMVCIDLCNSAYDTKLYIMDAAGFEVACNDDACSDTMGNPYRSELLFVSLTGGMSYDIGVDGYSGAFGPYIINMDVCEPDPPCVLPYPCVGTPEGEPCDDTGAPDIVNGGCNSTPAVFSLINVGDTVCGLGWASGGTRDTDWYELTGMGGNVTMTGVGQFSNVFGRIEETAGEPGTGAPDCGTITGFIEPFSGVIDPCVEASVSSDIPLVGYTWWFYGPSVFDLVPCAADGNNYIASWAVILPCPSDLDGDGTVGFGDLLQVLNDWGPCP